MLQSLPSRLKDSQYRDDLANVWTRRGIVLLNENTTSALAESISCFDEAIALRSVLPLDDNPWYRYGLTAAWMNRGDALTRLGGAENLMMSLRCYDEALLHLEHLPIDLNILFRKRRGIAWLNRGITLMGQGTPASLEEASKSFVEAITLLGDPKVAGDEEFRCLHAGAWMNLGNARIQISGEHASESLESARKALALVSENEAHDFLEAEIGFKARHILCRSVAHLLSEEKVSVGLTRQLVAESTDAVEEGIRLARVWEARGEHHFSSMMQDLFSFGGRVYQVYQPHFLVEFLMENLANQDLSHSRELYADALSILWREVQSLQHEGFRSMNTQRFEQILERFAEVRQAEAALRETWDRNIRRVT